MWFVSPSLKMKWKKRRLINRIAIEEGLPDRRNVSKLFHSKAKLLKNTLKNSIETIEWE